MCCESLETEVNGSLLGVDVFDSNAARRASPLVAMSPVLSSMLLAEWTQCVSMRLDKMPNIRLFPRLHQGAAETEEGVVGVVFPLSSWIDYGGKPEEGSATGGIRKRKRPRVALCSGGVDDSFREFSVFLAVSVVPSVLEVHCDLLFCEAPNTSAGVPGEIASNLSAVSFGLPKVRYSHALCIPGRSSEEPLCLVTRDTARSWVEEASRFTLDMVVRYAVQTIVGEERSELYLAPSPSATAPSGLYRAYNVKSAPGNTLSVACLNTEDTVTLLVLPGGASFACSEQQFCDLVSVHNTVQCLKMVQEHSNFVNVCVTSSNHVYVSAGGAGPYSGSMPPVCGAWATVMQLLNNWEELMQFVSATPPPGERETVVTVPMKCGACVLSSTALTREVSFSITEKLLDSAKEASISDIPLCTIALVPRCLQLSRSVALEQVSSTSLWVASVQWSWTDTAMGTVLKRFVESVVRNSMDEVSYIVDAHSLPTHHSLGAAISDTVVNIFLTRTFPLIAFTCMLTYLLGRSGRTQQDAPAITSANLWDSNRASFDVTRPQAKKSVAQLNVELVIHLKESTLLKVDAEEWKCSVNMENDESVEQFRQELSTWLDKN
jgi:hypothetical protein